MKVIAMDQVVAISEETGLGQALLREADRLGIGYGVVREAWQRLWDEDELPTCGLQELPTVILTVARERNLRSSSIAGANAHKEGKAGLSLNGESRRLIAD